MDQTQWKLLTCLWDVPSARVLTDMLGSEGITTRVVTDAVVMGEATPCRIFVDAAQAHRARQLLSQGQLSELELTLLATGGLPGEDDPE